VIKVIPAFIDNFHTRMRLFQLKKVRRKIFKI